MPNRKFCRLLFGCFGCYCLALVCILLLRGLGGHFDFERYPYWQRVLDRMNLVPFSTIREQLNDIVSSTYNRRIAIRNLAANALLFVPMGLFLPLLWEDLRKFRRCAPLWCGLILVIELVQLLTLQGSFDIDDVILNSLGFAAGFCVFKILHFLKKEEK